MGETSAEESSPSSYMIAVLVDHDIEGQSMLLWSHICSEGWTDLIPVRFVLFKDVGLPATSSDREVWHFAQKQGMILLTGNRSMRGRDSLERVIRDENTPTTFPVLTVSSVGQMVQKEYRDRCATKLLEVVLFIHEYLGVGRIFIHSLRERYLSSSRYLSRNSSILIRIPS